MTVRPGNADLPLADVMLRDMRRIGMPAAAPIPSTRRDGKGDRRFRAAFGGVWLGAYLSMVRINVRLSGQHKCHLCYPRG